MHNLGMAWDWRWAAPGPGRQTADEVIEFALAESASLGIQAVHDYVNARYWKNNVGWRTAHSSPATGFGQPWSQWLHIERTWDAANDPDPIDAASARAEAAPAQRVEPSTAAASTFEGELPTGPVRRGDSGADVARIQDFLRVAGFADFTISDGWRLGPGHGRRSGALRWGVAAMSITKPIGDVESVTDPTPATATAAG